MKRRFLISALSLLMCAVMLCPAFACAFAEEKAAVPALTLPKSLITIDEEAFKGTTNVQKVVLQNKTKRIESRAFAESPVREIHLTESVEYIADDAFEGCENLTLYVPRNSYAHKWAAYSDVEYVVVSDEPVVVERYRLSGLEVTTAEGQTAAQVYVTTGDEACLLQIRVVQEITGTVLASYYAEVLAGLDGELTQVPVTEALPGYFILEAVLTNAEGEQLCKPLREIRYSQSYASAISAKPSDYPAGRVVDFGDIGFAVLAEGVVSVPGEATVSGNDYEVPASAFGGKLPSVGDVLMLNVDGVPTPVKVGALYPTRADVIRIGADSEIYLCDAFDKLKVDGYVETDGESIGAGVGGMIPLDESYTSKNEKLTVTATGGVSVRVNVQYDKKFFREDYFEFDAEARVLVDVVGTLKDKYETEEDEIKLTLYKGKIIIPGINLPADLDITLPLNAGIEGEGVVTVHYEKLAGFTFDTDNGFAEKTEPDHNFADAELKVNFWADAGPKVTLDLNFWKFFGAKVDAQIGVELKGALEGDAHIGYEPPVEDDAVHGCNLCLGMDVDIFAEANANVYYKITKKETKDLLDEELFHIAGDLMEYHWSFINPEESYYKGVPSEGEGLCPNYKYKVKVTTKDMFGNNMKDVPVTITTDATGKTLDLTSPGECHLFDGNYTAEAAFESGKFDEVFAVLSEPTGVMVQEREMTIKVECLDSDTREPLQSVKVTATLPDGSIRTAFTDADGQTKFTKLRGGEYSFRFSKDCYKTREMSQSFVSGTNNSVSVTMERVKLPVLTASAQKAGTYTAVASDGTLPPDVPKLTMTITADKWGFFEEVVIRHADCKTALSYTPTYCTAAEVFGVDMGNGEYTYVLSLYNSGTGGGASVKVLRAVNGALKTYDLGLGKIGVSGKFTDDTHFTATLLPSNKAISGMMPLPYSGFKRAGGALSPMGDGYLNYVQNKAGVYDLEYSLRITQGGYNWDNIGSCMTKFVLKDGNIVRDSQWFEIYEDGVLD